MLRLVSLLLAASIAFGFAAPALAGDRLNEDGTWSADEPGETAPLRKPLPIVEVVPKAVARVPTGDAARFRGGVSVAGGVYSFEGQRLRSQPLGLFGLEGRLGIQATDMLGLYLAPSCWVGGGDFMIGRAGLSLLPEVTVDDIFSMAAGPEVFAIGSSKAHTFEDETHIGFRARAAFGFGTKMPGRRHAFVLGADLRLDMFDSGVGVAPTAALGYDAF